MAAFGNPQKAIDAVFAAQQELALLSLDGFRPRLRAGLHLGRPRRVGGDYLGVAVNVAARIGERAKADEILISQEVLARIDSDGLRLRRKHFLTAPKGAPKDLTVYRVER